jgi:hypothetical protein
MAEEVCAAFAELDGSERAILLPGNCSAYRLTNAPVATATASSRPFNGKTRTSCSECATRDQAALLETSSAATPTRLLVTTGPFQRRSVFLASAPAVQPDSMRWLRLTLAIVEERAQGDRRVGPFRCSANSRPQLAFREQIFHSSLLALELLHQRHELVCVRSSHLSCLQQRRSSCNKKTDKTPATLLKPVSRTLP